MCSFFILVKYRYVPNYKEHNKINLLSQEYNWRPNRALYRAWQMYPILATSE